MGLQFVSAGLPWVLSGAVSSEGFLHLLRVPGRFCCQGVSPREEIFGEGGSRCCPHIWHVPGCKMNFSTALSFDNKAGTQHILPFFFLM